MAILNYTGDLYAKLWKRKYIKLEMTAADVDKLQKENEELKAINAHTISQLNLQNGELIIENQKLKNKLQNKKRNPLLSKIEELSHDCFESLECLSFEPYGVVYLEKRLYAIKYNSSENTAYILLEANSYKEAVNFLEKIKE